MRLTGVYDFDFFVQKLQASQDASQCLPSKIGAEEAIRSHLFQLAQTHAERLVDEADVRSMWSLQLERVVHFPYISPALMIRPKVVDFFVYGNFPVILGVVDVDLENDELVFLLVISAELDGRC